MTTQGQSASQQNSPHLLIESRPSALFAAQYEQLPFPNIGPRQEIVFDLGITAKHGDIELVGIVIKGYNGHQLLFEQRWPGRMLKQHTGEQDLNIPAGTGIAVRCLQFMLHGYEQLTMVEVLAVGKIGESAQTAEAILQIPVGYPTQKTDLHFPLRGSWWAVQAADWSDQHKTEAFSQTYAIDFVKLGADNQFFSGNGMELSDHYSWDQPVYATAGGKVAYVGFDMPDLPPGAVPDPRMFRDDPRRILGNAVAISHANGEFSYFGHLKQLSLEVNEGQLIKRGTVLGRVGNSGHSPGPHLHFHSMTGPNLLIDQGLPIKFSHFWAGGQYFEKPVTIPTRMIVSTKTESNKAGSNKTGSNKIGSNKIEPHKIASNK